MKNNKALLANGLLIGFAFIGSFAIADNFSENSEFSPNMAQVAELTSNKPILLASNNINSTVSQNQADDDNLYGLAGNFAAFISETKRASSNEGLSSAKNIAYSVDKSSSLTRPETIDGAKAFGAVSALRSEAFMAGIDSAAQKIGHRNLVNSLKENPSLIANINGYEDGKKMAQSSLGYAFSNVSEASETIHKASYTLQLQSWSKVKSEYRGRLDAVAASWQSPVVSKQISDLDFGQDNATPIKVSDKILAAAALSYLGDENSALSVLGRGTGKLCATTAYLNLRMCLAATQFPFEHSFCLSKHAYSEFEDCAKSAMK